MVIGRIREHVAAHNWFAVSVDLAIVVVGVFIGTQANNWNEARIARAGASESRNEIIEDLKSNEIGLASRRAYYGTARDHAMAALAALERPDRPRGAQFLLDAYQATQTWQRPLVRAGFEEMAAAGLTRYVGDRKTRSRLTNITTRRCPSSKLSRPAQRPTASGCGARCHMMCKWRQKPNAASA